MGAQAVQDLLALLDLDTECRKWPAPDQDGSGGQRQRVKRLKVASRSSLAKTKNSPMGIAPTASLSSRRGPPSTDGAADASGCTAMGIGPERPKNCRVINWDNRLKRFLTRWASEIIVGRS